MGVLDVAGSGETNEPEDQTPAPGGQEPNPGDQGDTRARAEDGTFVSAEKLKPETPSRRTRAREALNQDIDARFKEHETRWTSERTQLQQQLAEERAERQRIATETARLQGALEEMRSRPATVAAPVPQGPDPEDLHREANKALQAGQFEEYQRLERQALRIEAKREAEAAIRPQFDAFKAEIQKQIPPNIPPHVQMLLMNHRNVAMAGNQGIQAVIAERQRLDIYRRDLTPEQREQMAFATADKTLAAMAQGNGRPAGYDQSSAAALSGVPVGNRGANGSAAGDAGGVHLTGAALEAQRKSGMTPEEYVKWSDPAKYGLLRQ